jgi:hypothetical protein
MTDRVRFRIPDRKGDTEYFADAAGRLAEKFQPLRLEANPATGSLLIEDEGLDIDAIVSFAKTEGLFQLEAVHPAPLARDATAPLRELSARLKESTLGRLDLPTVVFFTLIGVGTIQLLRNGLRSPPWYTAFWYAMGIYLKHLVEKQGAPDVS